MASEPIVDGRSRDELLARSKELASYYTDEWDPDTEDVGAALLEIFASMTADVVDRLDRVPERYRRSFFETLGFDRAPPQPARLPLTFEIADGLDRNVAVSEGTRTVAPAAEDRPETFFEVIPGGGFDASPANLAAVYSVRPEADHLGAHVTTLSAGESTELFGGDNHQEHALYLGHGELFRGSPPTVRIDLQTDAPVAVIRDRLHWEFYGERTVDDEPVEAWHPVQSVLVNRPTLSTVGDSGESVPGPIVEVSLAFGTDTDDDEDEWAFTDVALVDAVESVAAAVEDEEASIATFPAETTTESLWLRCRSDVSSPDVGTAPTELFDVSFEEITIVVGAEHAGMGTGTGAGTGTGGTGTGGTGTGTGGTGTGTGTTPRRFAPDELFVNDVPLPVKPDDDDDLLYPFGVRPIQFTAFSVASERAFTKPGTTVTLHFVNDSVTDGSGNPTSEPQLSWEYWDGDNWALLDVGSPVDLTEPTTVSFEVPDDLEPTTVAGQEGYWVRVRFVGGEYVHVDSAPVGVDGNVLTPPIDLSEAVEWRTVYEGEVPAFSRVELSFGGDDTTSGGEQTGDSSETAGLPTDAPEHAVSYNNLAFGDDTTNPFVGPVDGKQTLYLGFDGPLTDGPIQLLISATDREFPADFHSRVRWEYASDPASDEWERLGTTDESEGLTRRGIVGLTFPATTTAHARFGRELHWIRARVEGSQFGPATTGTGSSPLAITHIDAVDEYVELTNRGETRMDLSGLTVDFEYAQPVVQTRTIPDGTALDAGETIGIATWIESPVHGAEGVISFDFSDPVINDYTPDTVAVLDPDGRPLAVRTDQVGGTGTALVRPEETESEETQLAPGEETTSAVTACEDVVEWGPVSTDAAPCGEVLPTEPPTGVPNDAPPILTGLYPNATWAENVQTIADATLGSSDGTPDQTFTTTITPVTDEAVWIDELGALSEGARERLVADPTVEVDVATTGNGETTAFRVRWTRVESLFHSDADDRHYTLDPTDGVITFGDGSRGAIPSQGRENVRIGYRTGGGVAGNVPARAVDGLVSSLAFVDSVTNPEAADGGADAEAVEAVLSRAPKELRDRGRAVTTEDYERIALSVSRKLERTRCLPAMDAAGAFAPGWVTLLIVPRTARPKPVPSAELKRQVREAMARRAPITLVAPSTPGAPTTPDETERDPPGELVVRGPTYVDASVETRVVATAGTSVSTLEETLTERLATFLHPLTGGDAGEGWPFGTLPCLSDLYGLLEGVEGVDHVETLELTFTGSDTSVTVSEGEESPMVTRDVLVTSGTHDVVVTGGV